MILPEFRKRNIHLDFHTGPWIPDVGADFDPEEFARTFKEAHVDSVTVFALCHHGHAYWDTKLPARHPSLPNGMDILGEQIEALHKVGIKAPIYVSIQCNEFCANEHPDWLAVSPEGEIVSIICSPEPGGEKANPLKARWQIMDMSSPYQDYIAEVIQELMDKYGPTDGFWLDMCWDQQSLSRWAIRGMEKKGLDPRKEEDRWTYAHAVSHEYMGRYRDMINAAHKGKPVSIYFNCRSRSQIEEEKEFCTHVDIECLPTVSMFGYNYFPCASRFVRMFGLPAVSMTGRFMQLWGDNASLKPESALKYECCQALIQGLSCSVGDLLHPRGVPDKAVYKLIGNVYGYLKKCEPYIEGGELLSQIALIIDPEKGDPGFLASGAACALRRLRYQFDTLPPGADLSKYELVIIPETTRIGEKLKANLQTYLASGGALIVCGPAALDEDGNPAMDELGIVAHGESPYSHVFMRASKSVSEGLADYDYVMYKRGFRMTPAAGTEELVRIVEPYFERAYNHFSGHEYTPPDKPSEYAAAVRNGNVITFSVPIMEAYGFKPAPNFRILFGNCIDLLLPEPSIRDKGPSLLEATVMQKDGSRIVHLLSFCPEHLVKDIDVVEDPFPIVDMPISVKLDKKPSRAYLAPNERDLEFEYKDGYAHTRVTVLDGHAMLIFEE